MKRILMIMGCLLVAVGAMTACDSWNRGGDPSPPAVQPALPVVEVAPGVYVPAYTLKVETDKQDGVSYRPCQGDECLHVKTVVEKDGRRREIVQIRGERNQGWTHDASGDHFAYTDHWLNPGARQEQGKSRTGSAWVHQSASKCETPTDKGGIGGECYDPVDEVCDGVSFRELNKARGTCPRQLRCCPDPNAVRDRTEEDDDEERPAKPAAKAKAKARAGGDADDVPGDTGEPIKRGRK